MNGRAAKIYSRQELHGKEAGPGADDFNCPRGEQCREVHKMRAKAQAGKFGGTLRRQFGRPLPKQPNELSDVGYLVKLFTKISVVRLKTS